MTFMIFIILVGVALIDRDLSKTTVIHRNHNQNVQAILSEIRDRLQPPGV